MTKPLLNIYKLLVGFSLPKCQQEFSFHQQYLIVPHVVSNKVQILASAIVQITELAILPRP